MLPPRRRRQPHEPIHERFRADRHVVGGDQDEDERPEDAGHVQADGREWPDQAVGVVGVALDEGLDLVPHLAGVLARYVRVHLLEVLDDRRHVVHELVRLIHERRDQEIDDEDERANPAEQGHERSGRPRNPVALEPLRRGRERYREDDGHQHRQHERHELAEQQAEEEQPGRQEHGSVRDLRGRDLRILVHCAVLR
jgi:hypothetical protein